MSKQTKVSTNIVQDFTEAEQSQARANIGAASNASLSSLSNTVANNTYAIAGIKSQLGTYQWVKAEVDTNVVTEATELFTVGKLTIGYYFDNATTFRLSMKSTDGTRYIYLSDNMGYGGGYQVTSSWTGITMRGFSNSCQYESFLGYDCTADKPIHFEVQYANGTGSFTLVCRYRVLEG